MLSLIKAKVNEEFKESEDTEQNEEDKKSKSRRKCEFTINPKKFYMRIWDVIIKLLIIYSCFTVMFRSSFKDYSAVWILVIDYIFEFMFLIDMLHRFIRVFEENG